MDLLVENRSMTGSVVGRTTAETTTTTTAIREAASEAVVAAVVGGMIESVILKGTLEEASSLVETTAVVRAVQLVETGAMPDQSPHQGNNNPIVHPLARLMQRLPYDLMATRMSSGGTSGPLQMRTAQRLRARPSYPLHARHQYQAKIKQPLHFQAENSMKSSPRPFRNLYPHMQTHRRRRLPLPPQLLMRSAAAVAA